MPVTSKNNASFSPEPLLSVFRTHWLWCFLGALGSFLFASVWMSAGTTVIPNLEYPYVYGTDSSFTLWGVQRLMEGWIFDNPRSGYPFGSDFMDYPSADAANFLILKLLGMLFHSSTAAVNLYFLLGFSVTFITTFCVLRALGLSIPLTLAGTLLFDFQAFHFLRIGHLFYTWYFMIPIFYYMAIYIFHLNTKQTFKKSTLCFYALGFILLGSFGVYYALFGLIVIGTATLAMLIHHYRPDALRVSVFICTFVILGVVLNITPNLIHNQIEGKNAITERSPVASEVYGFKFVQLIMPRPGHTVPQLNNLATQYTRFPLVNENNTATLGLWGSLGLVVLFGTLMVTLAGKTPDSRLRLTALIVLILFMFGTIGGFGTVFALLISSSIRAWNRISIFISFGALYALFLFLQLTLAEKYSGKRFTQMLIAMAVVGIGVGLPDQVGRWCRPCNEAFQRDFKQDQRFIQTIEQSLPAGSAVYQLPYMEFPETPPHYALQDYGLTTGFIHSHTLRWSYGGMKNRQGDLFFRDLAKEPVKTQLKTIRELGFAGVYIDCRGFEDQGKGSIQAWSSVLGKPPTFISDDGHLVFFKINPS